MPPDPERQALGEPLSPGEGAYLQSELAQRKIETGLRESEDHEGRVWVEVRPADFAQALKIREEIFGASAESATESPPKPSQAARHRRSLLTAAVGAISVLYIGRRISPRLAGLAAILVGLAIYFVLSPRSDRDE